MPSVTVRPATAADGETLLALIDGLADYEHLIPPDAEGRVRFLRDLAEGKRFDALIAEVDGEPAGYSVYFEIYSTFTVRPKLYMEDLFVRPEFRSTGAGLALISAVARAALERNCTGIEWEVLDWNELAINFYERVGGFYEKQWLRYKMSEDRVRKLAGR